MQLVSNMCKNNETNCSRVGKVSVTPSSGQKPMSSGGSWHHVAPQEYVQLQRRCASQTVPAFSLGYGTNVLWTLQPCTAPVCGLMFPLP